MQFYVSMLLFIVAVLVVFFFPGRLFLAAFPELKFFEDTEKDAKRFLSIERIVFTLSLGVTAAGMTGLFLVSIRQFNVALLTGAVYFEAAAALFFNRHRSDRSVLLDWREPFIVALAIGVFLAFLGKPYEWLIAGGWDAGNYNNIAAQMVHTGSVLDYDLPSVRFSYLIDSKQWVPLLSNLREANDPFIYPRYYHLFSVYIAVFEQFSGAYCSQYVNAFFGLLALACFYLFLRRMDLQKWISLFGTALLMCTGLEFHYFKEVYSEMCAQYFFLASMVFLLTGLRENRPPFVYLAAFLFNGLLLVKMDAILTWQTFVLVAGASLLMCQTKERYVINLLRFSATLIPLFAANDLYAWMYTRPYLKQVAAKMQQTFGLRMTNEGFLAVFFGSMLLGLAVTALLSYTQVRYPKSLLGRIMTAVQRAMNRKAVSLGLRLGAVALVCLGTVYLFFIRPLGYEAALAASDPNAYKLIASIRLFYVFPPALMLFFVASMGILFMKKLTCWNCFAVCLPLLAFFYYMINISHQDLMVIWTYRRLIPTVIPFLVFGVTLFVHEWFAWSTKRSGASRRAFQLIGTAAIIISALMTVIHLKPFWGYTENEGIYDHMREVADAIPNDVPLLMQQGTDTNKVGSTLKFIFRKQCIVIRNRHFNAVVQKAVDENMEAWVANVSRETLTSLRDQFKVKTVHKWLFTAPWLRGNTKIEEDGSFEWLYPDEFILSKSHRRIELYRVLPK